MFDLDDTLIDIYRDPAGAWGIILAEALPDLSSGQRSALLDDLLGQIGSFLSDPRQRRSWRLEPRDARVPIIEKALAANDIARPGTSAADLALRYEAYRRDTMQLHPGALETLSDLRHRGIRLALITNGRSDVQRHKITHFGLAGYFDHIQIEGEAGYGKPDQRAFQDGLAALEVPSDRAWMIGDDPYYDIQPAIALGMGAVWITDDRTNILPKPVTRISSVEHTIGLLDRLAKPRA